MEANIGVKDMAMYLDSFGGDHLIVVTDKISRHAIMLMEQKPGLYFEVVTYVDSSYTKHTHMFVPTYTLMDEDSIAEVERRFGPRRNFTKMIARVDAMARYMDFRPGDVVKTSKKSTISGLTDSYRLVIAPHDHD